MEVTVIHIMESWPLQLAVQTPSGREQVALTEDVRIQRAGTPVDASALRPGQRVLVLKRTSRGEIAELEILD
jgi:hypothetical protein